MQNATEVKQKTRDWVCSYCADHNFIREAAIIQSVGQPTSCESCGRDEPPLGEKYLFRRPYSVRRAYKMLKQSGLHNLSKNYSTVTDILHLNPVTYAKSQIESCRHSSEIAEHIIYLHDYYPAERTFCMSKESWRMLRRFINGHDI